MQHNQRFTPQAREAATRARKERAERTAESFGLPEAFVTRGANAIEGFGWEIRKFGGVPLARSTSRYGSEFAAREAARAALASLEQPRHG